MTTSILSPENSALVPEAAEIQPVQSAAYTSYRIRHTLASRFAFLILCIAIILSALAFGTVHYWTQAIFFLGAVAILTLWLIDGWKCARPVVGSSVWSGTIPKSSCGF